MIAALYVLTNGPYFGLPNVDPWDEKRDARNYRGPHRVIAHPPCERWGRYWGGGPSAKVKRKLGDDDGCFEAAICAVRANGDVLEHPEASHAWKHFGLVAPPKSGGWVPAGDFLGYTCCVEQGHYGHPARKATWLYAVGIELPSLKWGPASHIHFAGKVGMDQGFHSKAERDRARRTGVCQRLSQRLSQRQRKLTPIPFRDLLISMVEAK